MANLDKMTNPDKMTNVDKFLIRGLQFTTDELRKDVMNLNQLVNDLTRELELSKGQILSLTNVNESLRTEIRTLTTKKETMEGSSVYNYLRSFIA